MNWEMIAYISYSDEYVYINYCRVGRTDREPRWGLNTELANEKYSIMEGAIKIYTKLKRKGKTHRSVADKNVADVNEIANSIHMCLALILA